MTSLDIVIDEFMDGFSIDDVSNIAMFWSISMYVNRDKNFEKLSTTTLYRAPVNERSPPYFAMKKAVMSGYIKEFGTQYRYFSITEEGKDFMSIIRAIMDL